MTERKVVVDDTDPSISYVGSWFSDNSGSWDNAGILGAPWLETLHFTSANGSVSFEFNGTLCYFVFYLPRLPQSPSLIGTDVEVYGTSNITMLPNNTPDPTLECFVDGFNIGREAPFNGAGNNILLCDTNSLQDGLHNLTIIVTVQSPTHPFWIDKIQYIPSPNLQLDNRTILVENTDPAIQFDAGWSRLGDIANMTTTPNSVAQVDFIGEYCRLSFDHDLYIISRNLYLVVRFHSNRIASYWSPGHLVHRSGTGKPVPLDGSPPGLDHLRLQSTNLHND
jgi:hypothetical protein